MNDELLTYRIAPGVEAFSTRRDCILPYHVITGHQVHDSKVAVIDHTGYTREDLEGYDAFMTDLEDCAIGVRTADCIPVLLYDPTHRAVAAVHAGWKGTVKRISQVTIDRMHEVYGSRAEDLLAVIGPGIGPDSFQVGEEVVEQFREAGFDIPGIWSWRGERREGSMEGGHHIDLWEANRFLLVQKGIKPENISIARIDTYIDSSFFSARRESIKCGRIINAIRIKSR